MKASDPKVTVGEKKLRHEILMERVLKEIDPPSPMRPHEKAITYTIPKRRKLPSKREAKPVSSNTVTPEKKSKKFTDWNEYRKF